MAPAEQLALDLDPAMSPGAIITTAAAAITTPSGLPASRLDGPRCSSCGDELVAFAGRTYCRRCQLSEGAG